MPESTPISALRRKAQAGQKQYQARSMTALRALRLSLSKVAEDEFDLALGVIGLTEGKASLDQVLDARDDGSLLAVLDTPGSGPGAAILDPHLVDALVQQQTTGRISTLAEGAPMRAVTRTDSALIAPYLDLLFRRAAAMPESEEDRHLFSGVHFGAYLPEQRLLALALEAPRYLHFAITVDLANGTRQGRLDLLFPPAMPGLDPAADMSGKRPQGSPQAKTLELSVMKLKADLRVALCRMSLPLSQIADFQTGDVLRLPISAVGIAEILTLDGRKLGQGRLGRIDGRRAFKLGTEYQSGDKLERRASDRPKGVPKISYDGEDPHGRLGDVRALPGAAETDAGPPLIAPAQDMALPDLAGLPELDSLPDLAGGPAPTADAMAGGGGLDGLPDLPDLPDLPPLP